jgi:hypothetical protein
MRHGALLSIVCMLAVLFLSPVWASDAPAPSPVAAASPAAPVPVNRRKEDETAVLITSAGPLDLMALLNSARNPLEMMDTALAARLEKQAQDMAKAYPEIAIIRALLVASMEATAVWKRYTDETSAHSTTRSELAQAGLVIKSLGEQIDAEREASARAVASADETQRLLSDARSQIAALQEQLAAARIQITVKNDKDGLRTH